MPEQTHRHAAIMFTDIVGYTALMGSDEDKAFELLRKNKEIHLEFITNFNGTPIKEMGDGMLISFPLASDAVKCAIEIQEECKKENIPLKIGIHEGEMVFAGEDVFGDGVNIASRLQEVGREGSIIISEKVYSEIKNKAGIRTRLIGDKKLKNLDAPISVHEVLCTEDEPKKSNRPYLYYLLGATIIILAIFLIWHYLPTSSTQASGEMEKSIAVLPFGNASSDEENQYFVDGMMEDIRNNLSKISELRVISKTSTEKYKETDLLSSEIGSELNVVYLLEGTVQKQGNQIKIHAQLIMAETNGHIWTETYERDISEVFKVQSEIAKIIAKELSVVITPEEKERVEAAPTDNLEAYDYLLKAKDLYFKYYNTGDTSYLLNISRFSHKALEFDPDLAEAYVLLGHTFIKKMSISNSGTPRPFFLDTAIFFFNKAIELDTNLVDGYQGAGMYYLGKGQLEKAYTAYGKVILLNPTSVTAYSSLGNIYSMKGDALNEFKNYKQAEKLAKGRDLISVSLSLSDFYRSIGEMPKSEFYLNKYNSLLPDSLKNYYLLAWNYYVQGKFEEELQSIKKVTNHNTEYYLRIAAALLNLGRFEEAEDYFRQYLEMGGEDKNVMNRIGYVLWMTDKKDEAMEYFYKQIRYCKESIAAKDPYGIKWAAYDLAGVYAFLGNRIEAYKWLNEFFKQDVFDETLIYFIRVDQMFDNLREEEKFKAMIQSEENKQAEIRAKIKQLEEEEGW